ncbi:MAG TPA: hypothetical protein VGH03_03590 [Caulobacteraceae bacterium]|jgi:hypothetical protein
MGEADRQYYDAIEQHFRALAGLRPPAGLMAYRIALLALREPLQPSWIANPAERR